ncbi:MAG: hypothetical protein IT313_05885 [Anaerolineales bacterium]|nr:hypothetical protein [Anaerolineales bacterium]
MISKLRQYPWWAQCILLWLCVWVSLNMVGLVGARFIESEQFSPAPQQIPGIWSRWDAGYYLAIVFHGYAGHPDAAGFFPLYPMLISLFYRFSGVNPELIGLFISNGACLIATLIFYKIARLVKDDHGYALRSTLALLVFPTSFFYFALYAESLYLLFALLGVYLALRSRQSNIGSGLALGLSSIARPVGGVLDIVMMIEFVRRRKFDAKSILSLGFGLALSILGVVLYVYYLYILFGSWTAISEAQAHWHRQWQFPLITYWEGLKALVNFPHLRVDWFEYASNVMDLGFASFAIWIAIVSVVWAKRGELPWGLTIYAVVLLLFFLSSQNELPTPLWGVTRWAASIFPFYFVLGNMFKSNKLQALYYTGSALLLILFTAWWTSGRWIG